MAGNAIDIVWRSDTSSVEAAANKVETLSKRQADAVQRAADRQVADNNRFIASIQRQVDTFGLSGTAMLQYEAKMRGVSSAADPLIAKLNEMKAAQAALNSQMSNGGSFKAITEGANTASHATAGMTRELLVLAHEASQGNVKRFGGSLLVMAEYSTTAQAAIRSLAGPIGIAIGAVGLLALAMYEGSKKADEFRKAMILTGGFAGQTAGSFDALTKSVAAATGGTLSKATEALQALVATGEVGPRELQKMAEATVKLETLTGKSAEEIAKDFTKMAEGPTKWAAEANKAYNFLTMPQYDYIKRLEEQGHKEDAEMEVLARLNDHLGKKIPESLSGLGQALHAASSRWDEFWHAAMHGGAPETVEDKLANIERQLGDASKSSFAALNRGGLNTGAYGGQNGSTQNSKDYLEGQRTILLHDQLRQSEAALSQATQARYAKAGIAASDYFSKLQEERKGTDRLTKDLQELQANIQKRIDGGGPKSLPEDADNEAFIRHRDRSFQDKGGAKLETEYQSRLKALSDEGIRLQAEIKNFNDYGKAVNDSARALLDWDIAHGKLGALSSGKIATLRGLADADDAATRQLADKKAAKTQQDEIDRYKQKIASINDESKALTARDQAIAKGIAALDATKIDKASAAYEELKKQTIDATAAKYDAEQLTKMDEYGKKVDDEVKKLDAETEAIGTGTLARLQLASALKIEAEARKLSEGVSPDTSAAIQAQAAIDKAKASAAISMNYDAGRTFESGSKIAFQKYQEDAGNAAKYAENMIGGSFTHMEDALLNFVHTGKLSFSSLFTFMADEFLRNMLRMGMSNASSGFTSGSSGGGGFMGGVMGALNSLGGMFGGGAASLSQASSIGEYISGAEGSAATVGMSLAVGTNYVPYDGMVATLHKGEAVVPAKYNPANAGGGAGHTFDFSGQTIQVGQGVSRGEVTAAVQQGNAQIELRVRRLMKQGALQ